MLNVKVGIIMGSKSDLPVMEQAAEALKVFDIEYDMTIVSAHRTPDRMFQYARSAYDEGIRVIIAGAGGAAHLPGMVASLATVPVIGVPIKSSNSLDGWDSLLSIAQMPKGIPVATVAVDGAYNAGILAAQILFLTSDDLQKKIVKYKQSLSEKVEQMIKDLEDKK